MRKTLLLIVLIVATTFLSACGERYRIDEPPAEKREITVLIQRPVFPGSLVRKFRAESLTFGAALDEIGSLEPTWNVGVRCEGGYNKQPPLYSVDMTVIHAGALADVGFDISQKMTMHELCMKRAYQHLEMLKGLKSDELKYFR